jgi:GDPmannose 4,6-dehydratase
MKRALICGISGQDGGYLARHLLAKGYEVWGTSRDAEAAPFANLTALGIRADVRVESVTLSDFRSVLQCLLKVRPDEVYNLSGQSSVALSFQQPVETLESISIGTMNLLEAIRFADCPVRLYNAGSSECFGDTGGVPADEQTPFRPRSPYALAKAAAFWQVANYREAYGLFACSGILFNHESPLRHPRFVTRKVVDAACRIAAGSKERLVLGDITIVRDWGWAPEYVDAMWRMLQQDRPDDFVVATGRSFSLQEFVAVAFESCGLEWRDHVVADENYDRPADIKGNFANPDKALAQLGWQAKSLMPDVVRMMVAACRNSKDHGTIV